MIGFGGYFANPGTQNRAKKKSADVKILTAFSFGTELKYNTLWIGR